MNAKYFLSKTLPLLFNPEASAEAMKNAQPTKPATGKEAQFTAGVMARLFPKPIISPEYKYDSVIFRMKAPEAKEVLLAAEILPKPKAMERDSDGIWTAELDEHIYETFTYYYIVDGTPVADPQNMYLAPSTQTPLTKIVREKVRPKRRLRAWEIILLAPAPSTAGDYSWWDGQWYGWRVI